MDLTTQQKYKVYIMKKQSCMRVLMNMSRSYKDSICSIHLPSLDPELFDSIDGETCTHIYIYTNLISNMNTWKRQNVFPLILFIWFNGLSTLLLLFISFFFSFFYMMFSPLQISFQFRLLFFLSFSSFNGNNGSKYFCLHIESDAGCYVSMIVLMIRCSQWR